MQVRGIICGSELPSCSKILKVTIKQTANSELFDERSLLITYNRAQTHKIIKYYERHSASRWFHAWCFIAFPVLKACLVMSNYLLEFVQKTNNYIKLIND